MANIGTIVGTIQLKDAFSNPLKAAGVAVAGFAAISVKKFAEFDRAMTESVAIMTGVTAELRAEMEKTARAVARDFEPSAKQAAESFFFLASAGLDAKQSIAALPQVTKFAQAGAFDMATATDLLTDAQSALGLTIRDDVVKNMENMARVSDVLVRANTLANAKVEQFATSLTSEAGAALKSFNIDIEEGVAVLAAFADQGVKAEKSGNALSRILRLMTVAAVNNKEAYKKLGVEVFDSDEKIRNMADIVEDLEQALGGLSDEQRVAALQMLGFQARVQGVILPLLGTSQAIRQYESELRKAGGFTDSVANKQLQSFSKQLGLARDRFIDVAITVGERLAPSIQRLAEDLARLAESDDVRSLGDSIARGFEAIVKVAKFVIENIDLIKAALAALIAIKFTEWAMGVVAGFKKAAAAGKLFQLSLGPIGIALAALTALYVLTSSKLKRFVDEQQREMERMVRNAAKAGAELDKMRRAAETFGVDPKQLEAEVEATEKALRLAREGGNEQAIRMASGAWREATEALAGYRANLLTPQELEATEKSWADSTAALKKYRKELEDLENALPNREDRVVDPSAPPPTMANLMGRDQESQANRERIEELRRLIAQEESNQKVTGKTIQRVKDLRIEVEGLTEDLPKLSSNLDLEADAQRRAREQFEAMLKAIRESIVQQRYLAAAAAEGEDALAKAGVTVRVWREALAAGIPIVDEVTGQITAQARELINLIKQRILEENRTKAAISNAEAERKALEDLNEVLGERADRMAEIERTSEQAVRESAAILSVYKSMPRSQKELDEALFQANLRLEIQRRLMKEGAVEGSELAETIERTTTQEMMMARAADEAAEAWNRLVTVDLEKVWDNFVESVQRSFADFFVEVFEGGEDALDSFGEALKNLLFNVLAEYLAQWVITQAKMLVVSMKRIATEKAAQQAANAAGGATGGGGGWMSMFGGGGGGGSALSAAGPWLAVAGIVAGIGYGMGWWGGGKTKRGTGTFGGEAGDIEWEAMGENAHFIARRFRDAAEILGEVVTELDIEVTKLGEVVLNKVGKNYNIGGASLAVLGIEDTAEAISEAVAVLAIRGAEFGSSVSVFVQAIIRGSDAVTKEALRADIEMGRAIENFGRSDFEQQVRAIGPEMDRIFDWLGQQLRDNVDQLGVGLDRVVAEEATRWRDRYNELQGIQPSPQEMREQVEREARLYEAEKALRIADLKARLAELKAEKQIVETRTRLGITNVKVLYKIEAGRMAAEKAAARGRYMGFRATREIYSAEQELTKTHVKTMAEIVEAGMTILDVQIAALNDVIAELEAIPPIDFGNLKIPGIGGGGGGGSDIASDRETVEGALSGFDLSLLSEAGQAIASVNQKWDDLIPLAHGNADLLERIAAARQKEMDILKQQLVIDPVKEFLGPEFGGTFFMSDFEQQEADLRARFDAAREANQLLLEETGERAIEFWRLNQAEIRALTQLAEDAIDSLGLPLESTRDRFARLGETFDFLRQKVDEGIISKERYAEVVAQVADAEFLALGDALMGFLERYYGDVEGFEDFRLKLEQVRFDLELANMRLQFDLLKDLGLLSEETIKLIKDTFDWIDKNAPELPTGGTGSGGNNVIPFRPNVSNVNQDRDRARDLLDRYLLDAMDPLTRALHQLEEDFDFIRAELGNTAEVQQAYAEALERIMRQHLDSIERLQQSLLLGDASPLSSREQLATAEGAFNEAVKRFQAGDLSVIAEIPGIVQQYLAAARDFFPAGSEAYAQIFRMVNAFLNEVLAVGGIEGVNLPAAPTATPSVQLPRPVATVAALEAGQTDSLLRESNRGQDRMERTMQDVARKIDRTNVLLGERRFARQVA